MSVHFSNSELNFQKKRWKLSCIVAYRMLKRIELVEDNSGAPVLNSPEL